MYKKVEDNLSLVRDTNTKAILNIDNEALLAYKIKRNKTRLQEIEFAELKKDVDYLKDDISQIKNMLHTLLSDKKL